MTKESYQCTSEYFCRLSHSIGQITAGSTQSAVSVDAPSIAGHIQRGRGLQVTMREHRVAQTFIFIWEVKNKMWLRWFSQFLSPTLSVVHWKEKFSFSDGVYSLSSLTPGNTCCILNVLIRLLSKNAFHVSFIHNKIKKSSFKIHLWHFFYILSADRQ